MLYILYIETRIQVSDKGKNLARTLKKIKIL